ncbi:ornithine carbamoyltransferase [Suttonella ornithocola]|uniref:Ornithine carbamoyltransferase n=1 Tax=Suttonella ornithocola TaxID=279832 RepID=A0A380MMT8_9GAMM|nr:ornithine carbamoyltransferase [Suttonella ornithocola]SUO93568.1 Ornithine carbamoyltransferase, catabolic [Suttonella ornithocola]
MQHWYKQSLLRLSDHPREAVIELLTLASRLKQAKKNDMERPYLLGKNIALIFEKTSTRTRCAFEVAAADQGAHTTYIAPGNSQLGEKESVADTARVLGRMYDAIEYRGFAQETVEALAKYAGVPVYNGLTDLAHPTQMLADLLTMQEYSNKPLNEIAFAYLGDARFNMGNSLLLAGALMGMDVRIAAPHAYQPERKIIEQAQALAKKSGARLMLTSDPVEAVRDCDFVHTDIWVSMGEAKEVWEERIAALLPYRVTTELMTYAIRNAKFMHCLPAYHDRSTPVGETFFKKHKLAGIEVSHNVFESEASIVFDQAENRLHTIKALMVATLSDQV